MTKPRINIFVAGHRGMVGSAICRELSKNKDINLITKPKNTLNLENQSKVQEFFEENRLDQVYLAAAKVGGIHANNKYRAEFIYQNLIIQCNIIHSAFLTGVKKLLFLGSSCIYPKYSDQPIKEDELLKGLLEPTNEPYAVAKIAGIKLCENYTRQYGDSHGLDYRCLMPTNLYGPGDSYHPENSHVLPALLRKFHDAKIRGDSEVTIWGSGKALREFLHSDDLAKAAIFVMNIADSKISSLRRSGIFHINVGSGQEITIKNLAELIAEIVNYKGSITYDQKKPDGTPRKLLDSKIIKEMGWGPSYNLKEGIINSYKHFLENQKND